MRASGPDIRVFALGEGQGELTLDRSLRIRERAALQGFPAWIACVQLSEKIGRRIFGNAMSVPVIGSVLAEELRCIQAAWGASHAADGSVHSPLHLIQRTGSSIGPATREHRIWHAADKEQFGVMPGQRAAVVAQARVLSEHWDQGRPGRAPKRHCPLEPADHMALAWRSVQQAHPCEASALTADASGTMANAAASSSELLSGSAIEQPTVPVPTHPGPCNTIGIPAGVLMPSDGEGVGTSAAQPLATEDSDAGTSEPEPVLSGFY